MVSKEGAEGEIWERGMGKKSDTTGTERLVGEYELHQSTSQQGRATEGEMQGEAEGGGSWRAG